jgi:hypothetical protein
LKKFEFSNAEALEKYAEEVQFGARVGLITETMILQLSKINEHLAFLSNQKVYGPIQLLRILYEAVPSTTDQDNNSGRQELYTGPFTRVKAVFTFGESPIFVVERFKGSSSEYGPMYGDAKIYFSARFQHAEKPLSDNNSLGRLLKLFNNELKLNLESVSLKNLMESGATVSFNCNW